MIVRMFGRAMCKGNLLGQSQIAWVPDGGKYKINKDICNLKSSEYGFKVWVSMVNSQHIVIHHIRF